MASEAVSQALTGIERLELAKLEERVERGLQTFYEVGAALMTIRDARLYRESHATFEDYCRDRWAMNRGHANRLIQAAEVISNLDPMGSKPTNERQTRELAALPPEAQVHAWSAVTEMLADEPVTAALVHDVVEVTREAIADGVPPEQMREEIKARVAHVSHNSGNNEWYTPPEFIAAARDAMGAIDLDPASSDVANGTVRAKSFYTPADDGLTKPWHGNVWMNPPYAQPLIAQFAERVADKFDGKEIKRACVLVNNATETAWFQRMLASSSAVCLLRGRIRFIDPEGKPSGAPLQGQAVLYMGENPYRFARSFAELGHVLMRPE
jgi:ParB family chromosome partitioning protein